MSWKDEAEMEEGLLWLAQRLAALHPSSKRLSHRELLVLCGTAEIGDPLRGVVMLLDAVGLSAAMWELTPRHDALPMVAVLPGGGCQLIYGRTADGNWMIEGPRGVEQCSDLPEAGRYLALNIPPDKCVGQPTALDTFKSALNVQKGVLLQVALATVLGNFLALGGSLYSMQVYDRVIPTQGIATLVVLTSGVLISALLELVLKGARSAILERALKEVDLDLSHRIFLRLLNIRMDQFPASVGTLSSQVRSYESIRAFASSAVLYLTVDVPFAVIFLFVMVLLAGPLVAAVPAIFFFLSLGIGMFYRKRIQDHAQVSTAASNRKLGLLVETVEGAESVKTCGAGWYLLNRWSALSRQAVAEDLQIRNYSEHAAHLAAFMQQASYIMLVCAGAYIAATGNLTQGALVACSILSGRVLAPVAQLPGLIVQWGQSKAALDNLEKVFALHNDNHDISSPLAPEIIKGRFDISDLCFSYRNRAETLILDSLVITPGEKVGVLGVVGAGKSTLLKLLAGIYLPQQGRVLLDGLDMQHISRAHLSEQIGFLPQEMRLFAGTLRDNLLFGLVGVSEQDVLNACEKTGLISLVAGHPKGLDLEIAEGGSGVSGGQKQLIAFTRLLLARPNILLLDEPTSSMDEATEVRTLSVLRDVVSRQQTMVLVTHKPSVVSLVDRLIVLTPRGIVLDGPRDVVLHKLRQRNAQQSSVPNVESPPLAFAGGA